MPRKALEMKRQTARKILALPVPVETRQLLAGATYKASPHHKARPGDFRLIPPVAPRRDKTLCDSAGIDSVAQANALFQMAVTQGLVSEATTAGGFPKQLWVVDDAGRVFEAMHGGAVEGCYHGYPIRKDDSLHAEVVRRWELRQ